MKLRPLGSTGIMVSPLGLGSVKFGRNQGVKYPSPFHLPDDSVIDHLLDLALDYSINVIDTAPAYGDSELRLGNLLKNRRKNFCLVTKAGEEFENGVSSYDFSARHIRFSIERSLNRLRTDYLDVVLIHSDGDDMRIINQSDAIETLQSLQKRGLVRAIGMSTKTIEGGLATLQRMDIAMVTYNLNDTREVPVIDYAAKSNKGILVKKALASGHLGYRDKGISDKKEESMVARSFWHVFANPGISSVIVGSISPEHLVANARAIAEVLN